MNRMVFLPALVAMTMWSAVTRASADEDLINPDRPGIADGSTVIGPHRFQIETAVQKELRRQGDAHERRLFIPTLLRFGIDQTWEVRLEGNTYTHARAFDPATGVHSTTGYAPESLGVKYHFQDSQGSSRPSLGAILRLFPPSGSSDFRTHHPTGDLRLAADWDFAPPHWSLNPNVGLAIYEDDAGKTFAARLFALTLNYFDTKKTFNPFVDMGLQSPEVPGSSSSLIIDGGIAYILNPNLQLDFSVGTGAHGGTPPHPFWAAGISVRM
jgi:hypothetical protein